jgi:ABC-type phosphate transport system permease subunit
LLKCKNLKLEKLFSMTTIRRRENRQQRDDDADGGVRRFRHRVLLIILRLYRGARRRFAHLQFLIDTPKPVGEGGGIGNAIVGSR